jgi:hypothetical protein
MPDATTGPATACGFLAILSGLGAAVLALTTFGETGMIWPAALATWPGIVSAVVLWTVGEIAMDVRATRLHVVPIPVLHPPAESVVPWPGPLES